MKRLSVTRFVFTVAICLTSIPSTQGKEPSGTDEIDAKIEQLAILYAPADTPNIAEKPYVEIDTGPANYSRSKNGWLIEQDEQQLLLLDWGGEFHRLKKAATQERPLIPQDENGVFLSDLEKADFSIVWGIELRDLKQEIEDYLKETKAEQVEQEPKDVWEMSAQRYKAEDEVAKAAHFAFVAHVHGYKQEARELYRYAEKSQEHLRGTWVGAGYADTLQAHLIKNKARSLRIRAVFGAHNGDPRGEVLKLWQRLLALPKNEFKEEAELMVEGYTQLIDEDTRWTEPTEEERKQFSRDQKFDYWLYKLRDHNAGQWSDPGMCNVFMDPLVLAERETQPNPAKEISDLGVEIVPRLIEHMDDMRPTRCKGHWRRFVSEGHMLLRYGDCCVQIFERITEHQIYRRRTTNSYMTYDGDPAACKVKAQAWWDEYQKTHPIAGKSD